MTKTARRPKCRSKVVPCPAGDRCPEHRGLVNAIQKAAEDTDLGRFLTLKNQEATKEEQQQRDEFLAQVTIKQNRKGDTVVKYPAARQTLAATDKITVYREKTGTLIVPKPHPADAVDKTKRLDTVNTFAQSFSPEQQELEKMRPHDKFNRLLQLTYDGNASITIESSSYNSYHFSDMKLSQDYTGKHIERQTLSSVILATRPDLYEYTADESFPYDDLHAAGFEPNQYYWAGRTHPDTGVTYPTASELQKLETEHTEYSHLLRTHKYQKEHAYIRPGHGHKIEDHLNAGVPLGGTPTREQRLSIGTIAAKRMDGLQQARMKNDLTLMHV